MPDTLLRKALNKEPQEVNYPRRIYWLSVFITVMVIAGAIFMTKATLDQSHREATRALTLQALNHQLLDSIINSQTASARAGIDSRRQNRCIAWNAQNSLLQLILGSPMITEEQARRVRETIQLPSLEVTQPGGTTTKLNCEKVIKEPVPGLGG